LIGTPQNSVPRAWKADLALAGITLIWGSTFVVVKRALEDVSALLFLGLRFGLASVALSLVFRRLQDKPGDRRTLLVGGTVTGAFLFGGYLFQTLGLKYTTPSKSAFITGLSIVMVPLLSATIERRQPMAAEVAGILTAACGMALMTLGGEALWIGKGDLLTLFCAVAFAFHIVTLGHYAPKVGVSALSLMQFATAAALAGASFWWAEPVLFRWRLEVLGAVAVTGLLATALAFWVQAWAQQYTSPTRTALIFALEPVFAWLTAFLLTGELLSLRTASGALLILAGILLVELKPTGGRAI
jgi:drug/metabolite transporter (DMT)-like permease